MCKKQDERVNRLVSIMQMTSSKEILKIVEVQEDKDVNKYKHLGKDEYMNFVQKNVKNNKNLSI